MRLSDENIDEFKRLIQEEFKMSLTQDEVRILAGQILHLYEVIFQQIKKHASTMTARSAVGSRRLAKVLILRKRI